jgi:lambda family phage portal protein
MALNFTTLFRQKKAKRSYEGAAKTKRLSRWYTPSTSANAETIYSLPMLRNRSRDLRRNNPYAAKAVQVITSNVIGPGIRTQFRAQDKPIDKLNQDFKAWAHTPAFDFEGRKNIFAFQSMVMDAVNESGEVIILKKYSSDPKAPLSYQILEPDFIDTTKDQIKTQNGNLIQQGIEQDENGKVVAYWIFDRHPGGTEFAAYNKSYDSKRVSRDDLMHVFRADRPGQMRGVPWCASIIVRLKDFDDYQDAQLVRQKIAACFVAFIRDIGADSFDQDDDCGSDLAGRFEPGIIEELPPGKTVEFGNPPTLTNYKEYTTAVLHSIAAGYGVTYEVLTGDLSNVNFSSARMGWLDFQRNIEVWRNNIIIPQFLDVVAADFLRVQSINGLKIDGIKAIHTPPRREMIDPTKEVPAKIKSVKAGFETLSEAIMSYGKDPVEHLEQYKKDMELLDKLGLTLDSDARIKDDSGQLIDQNGGENAEEN